VFNAWDFAEPDEIIEAAHKRDALAIAARGNRVVPTNLGPIELEPGRIDRRAKDAFAHGQCHSLALALHQVTGWPMFGIGGAPNHFIVYCPDLDTYIDIDGPGAETRNQNFIAHGLVLYTPAQISSLENYMPINAEIAAPFAKTLLELHVPLAVKGVTRKETKKHLTLV
jgi:hypothetical protein